MRPITDNDIERLNKAFSQHKHDTKGRLDKAGKPIEFRLSFDEWFSIWYESGVWHLRGVGKGKFVMSRLDDLGHYEPGNVKVQPHSQNVREGHLGRCETWETRAKQKAANHKRYGTEPFVGPRKPRQLPMSDEQRKLRQREQYQWHQAKAMKVELDSDRERIKAFYLNCPDGMVVDHITPMSLGGSHTLDNLQYLDWQASRHKGKALRAA